METSSRLSQDLLCIVHLQASDGNKQATYSDATASVLFANYGSDDSLVCGGADNTIRLYKTNPQRLIATMTGHTKKVIRGGVRVASNGDRVKGWGQGKGTLTRERKKVVFAVCGSGRL